MGSGRTRNDLDQRRFFQTWRRKSRSNKMYKTQPFYHQGGIEKSVIRGYTHKFMVLCSPLWMYMTWPGSTWCQWGYYLLTSGSLFGMFLCSSIFHHYEHSLSQYAFWRRMDVCWLAIGAFANTLPALIFFELYFNVVCYMFLAGATALAVCFLDPRQGIIGGTVVCLLYTLFATLPLILTQIDPSYAFALFSHIFSIITAMMCYLFPDNDSPQHGKRPILATHDIIHLITISYALNFMYYNYILHSFHLC